MATPEEKAAWPKSVRLNQDLRNGFINAVLADVIPESTRPDSDAFVTKWQDQMYDLVYTPEVRAAMAACPSWMFKKTNYIFVSMGAPSGRRAEILKFKCLVPGSLAIEEELNDHGYASHNSDVGLPWLDKEHPAVIEYRDIERQSNDWKTKKHQLASQLNGIAAACNTSHQLFEAWPGALQYAEKCFPQKEAVEPKRGGKTEISAQELNIGIMMAKASVGAVVQS